MHVQLEMDMEQQTGCKLGREYVKAVYCHPAYLTDMQSTSWEMLGWKKHKLESRLPGEISKTSDMQMTTPLWQKVKTLKMKAYVQTGHVSYSRENVIAKKSMPSLQRYEITEI